MAHGSRHLNRSFRLRSRTTPSEREHHLQIDAAVCRLRIEHASGQRGRLAKKSGAQVPDRRTRIDFVEDVARVGAEGKAIALVRSFRAAHAGTATRAAHHRATRPSNFAART